MPSEELCKEGKTGEVVVPYDFRDRLVGVQQVETYLHDGVEVDGVLRRELAV